MEGGSCSHFKVRTQTNWSVDNGLMRAGSHSSTTVDLENSRNSEQRRALYRFKMEAEVSEELS